MTRQRVLTLGVLILASCVEASGIDAKPYDQEIMVKGNYQAVYASMLRTMRHCLKPGTNSFPPTATSTLDGQLYSELGYGEIISGMSGAMALTQSMVRISKVPGGTKVQTKSGNMIDSAQARDRRWLAYWARGGTTCTTMQQLLPPQ